MQLADPILWIVSVATFLFFVTYAISTYALIGISLAEVTLMKVERGELFSPPARLRRPGISLLAPAFDMEPLIVANVSSLLESDYDPLEVIVVDDGSSDGTTTALIRAYDLIELRIPDRLRTPTAPITNMYVSRVDPRLRLVRKENGGRSDAINAGLNVTRNELVAMIDADTLLDHDALSRVAEVFAADPDDVIAVGGTVRVANGALIDGSTVIQPRIAKAGIEATQTGEYLRSFLGTRIAWSRLNGVVLVSGAFGVFRRDLIDPAGLSSATLGEDMELVLRMQHRLHGARPRTRVAQAPDATAWTETPAGLAPLRGQRIRWHVGLFDNVRIHREMIFRRRYGALGLLALPYTVAFEMIAPLLQLAGYGVLVVLILRDQTSWWYVGAFVVVTLLAGQAQTAGAILIEEVGFRRYRSRDLVLLGCWSALELFWYQPLTAAWRGWATLLVLLGRRPGWGRIPRGAAFRAAAEAEPEPAPLPR
jgi:cellulose synthase/poly-beta-1,6-N-acetylglucosamine synthase-like glycosyltransferase